MSCFAILNPVGTISLVGRVPVALAYNGADDQFAHDVALSGPRIAKLAAANRGVPVTDRVFSTMVEVVNAGRAIRIEVTPT